MMNENLLSKTAHLEHTHTEKRCEMNKCFFSPRVKKSKEKQSQGISWRWSEDTHRGFMTLARV